VTNTCGRPGKRTSPPQPDANVYLGWLARTHRYDANDIELATAATFATRLAGLPGAAAVGPAMISRLESGTANWRVEHLISYARALNIPATWLLAPAYKVHKLFGRSRVASLLRVHYTDDDEQTVADLVDAVRGGDPMSAADWDLLSGYMVDTRRKLGMRTWAALCERLLLEICTTQGAEQDIRAEALIRLVTLERVTSIANAEAIGIAGQAGNPMSFMPLKIFQRLPRKAPHSWIVQALLNPPNAWLLRELFTTVAVLVATGEWQPSTRHLAALRHVSTDATADADLEMEVRRASLQLLRILDHRATQRILPRTGDIELIYLAKPTQHNDPQHNRYDALAAQLVGQVQDIGLRWQSKWTAGEDHILAEVLTQTLFGRDDTTRSGYTTLIVNSGYATAVRQVLVQQLARADTYQDATVARALIRLLGKIAAGERDGRTLLHLINSAGLDVDTRIQACWALANAAPRLPSYIVHAALQACRQRSFGHQSVTALRAVIAASGRTGLTTLLRNLLNDPSLAPSARYECAWWLSLPKGVLASTSTPP
jgi:hypothetical protein